MKSKESEKRKEQGKEERQFWVFKTQLIARYIVILKMLRDRGKKEYVSMGELCQVFQMTDIPESPTLHQFLQRIYESEMLYLRSFKSSNGYLPTYQ